jgi:hypothetical protein
MEIFNLFKKKEIKPKFKIGDLIICVDDTGLGNCNDIIDIPLIYKRVYQVKDIQRIKDYFVIEFGSRFINENKFTHDGDGNNIPGRGIRWFSETRFRLADDKEKELFFEKYC